MQPTDVHLQEMPGFEKDICIHMQKCVAYEKNCSGNFTLSSIVAAKRDKVIHSVVGNRFKETGYICGTPFFVAVTF